MLFETDFEFTISLDVLFYKLARGPINFLKDSLDKLRGMTIQVEIVEMTTSSVGNLYPVLQWNYYNGSADDLLRKIHPSELARTVENICPDISPTIVTNLNSPELLQAGFNLMKSGNWDKHALQAELAQEELESTELSEALNCDEVILEDAEFLQEDDENSTEENY